MPSTIALPGCLMDCYRALFPKLDFSRITFHLGLPDVASAARGFTMCSGGLSGEIRIYLQEYDPCDKKTFLIIAHELVHAVQIQGMTGGGYIPGSWGTYYTSHWLGCGLRGSECRNALEKEAYDYANGGCGGPGKLQTFIKAQLGDAPPCQCTMPWPTSTGPSYANALAAAPGLAMTKSKVGRTWCSLLNPFFALGSFLVGGLSIFGTSSTGGAVGSGTGFVVGAALGGYFGTIVGCLLLGPLGCFLGGAVGGILGGYLGGILGGAVGSFLDDLFSGPTARIWFTAFDGGTWVIPDNPISRQGDSRTSKGPGIAAYKGNLYVAYRASSSDDIWYNTLDSTGWLPKDLKITKNGHTRTSEGPALAAYDGKLYMAYKAATSNDLWYNVFDGNGWLPQDIKITSNGHTRTSHGPALAVYNGKLYMAYKAATSNDLWYNVFDGNGWLPQDIKITSNGHTRTSHGPALATYNDRLYLAYKANSGKDLWYNVFDDSGWQSLDNKITEDGHVKSSHGPALATVPLAVGGQYVFMVYRDSSKSQDDRLQTNTSPFVL